VSITSAGKYGTISLWRKKGNTAKSKQSAKSEDFTIASMTTAPNERGIIF
jgi:hypothetical protein